jgi:hypothetical protein
MSISATYIVLVTVAATLWAPRAHAAICVDVDLHFPSPAPSRSLVATLEHEATAIWAPYDVELRWGSPACAIVDASFDVVVERHLPRVSTHGQILGTTLMRLTRIERVPILIDYDATERTLAAMTSDQLTTSLVRRYVNVEDMGRAFGRVLAHEIGHVLLGLPSHQRHGLMRRAFRATELVRLPRGQYTLSPIEIARLHQRSLWIVANRNRAGAADHDEDRLPDYGYRQ